MSPRTAAVPENTQIEEIIGAALERFLLYGYTKTTMAEIARDVDMSAANLYRFFDNKQDIAAACCTRCINERLDRLRMVVKQSRPIREQLERYAMTMLEHTHEIATADDKIEELIAIVTQERPTMIQEKLRTHYAILTELLSQAEQRGEIFPTDTLTTAKSIYSAFVVFDVPIFVGLYSKAEYKRRVKGIVALIVDGIAIQPTTN